MSEVKGFEVKPDASILGDFVQRGELDGVLEGHHLFRLLLDQHMREVGEERVDLTVAVGTLSTDREKLRLGVFESVFAIVVLELEWKVLFGIVMKHN